MSERTMIAPYMRYPLSVSPRIPFGDDRAFDPTASVQMVAIVFRRTGVDHYECMACAECGNEWIGYDWQAHGSAHQMGFDYALFWQSKAWQHG